MGVRYILEVKRQVFAYFTYSFNVPVVFTLKKCTRVHGEQKVGKPYFHSIRGFLRKGKFLIQSP